VDKWTALRCSPACPLIHRPYGYGCYPFGNIYYEATKRPSVTVSFDASRDKAIVLYSLLGPRDGASSIIR